MGKILVTYASNAGSTEEVANRIGEMLVQTGATVDVLPVDAVDTLTSYQAVVIGSPIHSGKWLPDALTFVQAHQATLKQLPVALFVLGLRLRDESADNQRTATEVIARVIYELKPVSVGLFAGVMDYSKLSALVRLQAQTKGLPEGDYRKWAVIEQWAGELLPLLSG
jgi:menaquinone-dependent protoporphyrinogen oxidase